MATVTLTSAVAGQILTAVFYNNNQNAIINQVNGNLDSTNLANLAVTTAKINTSAVTTAKLDAGLALGLTTVTAATSDYVFISDTSDSGNNKKALVSDLTPSGSVVQSVSALTLTSTTGTTVIPFDDTIPQNTEGFQVITQAITPLNASNILEFIIPIQMSDNITGVHTLTVALFQDSTANALACAYTNATTSEEGRQVILTHRMVAGTTSSTTFNVRIGSEAAGTVTFNGLSGSRKYGGVLVSGIFIKEMKA